MQGILHAEIVRQAEGSDGTVSVIRQQLHRKVPLYRNTESPFCVSFACRKPKTREMEDEKPVFATLRRGSLRAENLACQAVARSAKAGGPGRIRTCDNTVMSGAKKRKKPPKP